VNSIVSSLFILIDFNLSLKEKEIMDIFLDIDDDKNNVLSLQEFQR